MGSLRYAVSHFPLSLKLVVVLGHAQCGAVTEAVKLSLEAGRYLYIASDHSLRSIEDRITVGVLGTVRFASKRLDSRNSPTVKVRSVKAPKAKPGRATSIIDNDGDSVGRPSLPCPTLSLAIQSRPEELDKLLKKLSIVTVLKRHVRCSTEVEGLLSGRVIVS